MAADPEAYRERLSQHDGQRPDRDTHRQVIDSSWPAPGCCSGCFEDDDYLSWPEAERRHHRTAEAGGRPVSDDDDEFMQCPHEIVRATCVGGCNCPCGPCAPQRPRVDR
jgi:hypothetical protein